MSLWNDDSIAQKYLATEHVTGPPARHMIRKAGLLHAGPGPLVVLDNACGTGVVTYQLYEMLEESAKERLQLTCGDLSERMVQATQERIDANGWKGAKAQVVDAQKTDLPNEFFTHVLTNFGFMLLPDPTGALNECSRILKSGGVCAFSTWETIGWVPDVRAALATITGAPPFPDTETFRGTMSKGPWHLPEFVEQQLATHGFEEIKVEVVPSSSFIESSAFYAEQYSEMTVQLTAKFWSDEDRDKYGGLVKPALLKCLTEKYGEGKPFEMEMVAIVATARKP